MPIRLRSSRCTTSPTARPTQTCSARRRASTPRSSKSRPAGRRSGGGSPRPPTLLAMIDILFIGLSLASILLLVSMGLAITYGAMGVINMAHGEMVMVGAYTTVMSSIWLGTGILIAIPLAFIVTALLGLLIERVVVRRLYGRLLDTLLATWGIAILIQQAVRLGFGLSLLGIHIEGLGPGLQNVSLPAYLQGTFAIGGSGLNR